MRLKRLFFIFLTVQGNNNNDNLTERKAGFNTNNN